LTPNLYVALTHYPVVNKTGDTIASAVTNLDLHDIARAARTYGVRGFYVITPLTDQQILIARLVSHWVSGAGARYNPKRREALELIRTADTLDTAIEEIRTSASASPKTVATSAKPSARGIRFSGFRELLKTGAPYILIFGTAWGLAPDLVSAADYVLEPVIGSTGYNHLSVRSAAAVILDRLLGTDR